VSSPFQAVSPCFLWDMASLGAWVMALAATGAQMGMDQMPKKPKPAPLNDDLKYIKCEACNKAVAAAYEQAKALTSMSLVEDMLERVCDADNDGQEGRGSEGKWMNEFDIVKRGQALALERQGPGYCRRECRTIAKACDGVLGKMETDELGEVLLAAVRDGTSAGVVAQRVCIKMAGVCKKGKVPLWPEGKVRKNEQFQPKDKKDLDLERLMESLKDMPGGGGGGLSMMKPGEMDLGDDKVDDIDVLKDEI